MKELVDSNPAVFTDVESLDLELGQWVQVRMVFDKRVAVVELQVRNDGEFVVITDLPVTSWQKAYPGRWHPTERADG